MILSFMEQNTFKSYYLFILFMLLFSSLFELTLL